VDRVAILVCYWLYAIDIRCWPRWSHPFVVLGMNAIALFVVSGVIAKALIIWRFHGPLYHWAFAWAVSPKMASLLYSVAFLAAMYAICVWLFRRRIF
jgi:predicted acyltransferase